LELGFVKKIACRAKALRFERRDLLRRENKKRLKSSLFYLWIKSGETPAKAGMHLALSYQHFTFECTVSQRDLFFVRCNHPSKAIAQDLSSIQ